MLLALLPASIAATVLTFTRSAELEQAAASTAVNGAAATVVPLLLLRPEMLLLLPLRSPVQCVVLVRRDQRVRLLVDQQGKVPAGGIEARAYTHQSIATRHTDKTCMCESVGQ